MDEVVYFGNRNGIENIDWTVDFSVCLWVYLTLFIDDFDIKDLNDNKKVVNVIDVDTVNGDKVTNSSIHFVENFQVDRNHF